MASFHPNLGRELALFSRLGLGTSALSGDTLTSGLLLFGHVCDRRDHGFEQRLQLLFLTEALHQFDPGSHRTFASVFEGVERAARHAHAQRRTLCTANVGGLRAAGYQSPDCNRRLMVKTPLAIV